MKHWKETGEILGRVIELAALDRRASLATVVRILGSAYRRPGAKFLVEDDGRTTGGVSGGCLEADVREVALEVTRTFEPRLLHYDTGSDDRTVWGLGLGCNGSVDVFVQPATTPAARRVFSALRASLEGDAPLASSTVISGPAAGRSVLVGPGGTLASSADDGGQGAVLARLADDCLTSERSCVRRLGAAEVFTEALTPPPHLVVCGAGDDARPLVACAADAGFRVTIVDHRPAYLSAERFPAATARLALRADDEVAATLPAGPRTCAVVMTHSLGKDREWLRRFLAADPIYVGLLGPRERCARLLDEVGAPEHAPVFGPVGLDIGAEGPEQIAISVVAELLGVLSRREPSHLRGKERAIHA